MKIELGEGWRLLNEDDTLCRGDQYLHLGEWIAVLSPIGDKWQSWFNPCRRKIEVEDRWIPLSESMPDKFPIQVWNGESVQPIDDLEHLTYLNQRAILNKPTHWKPLRLSPPPEPEVSPDEKAFEAWWNSVPFAPMGKTKFKDDVHVTWLAALEYARGKK